MNSKLESGRFSAVAAPQFPSLTLGNLPKLFALLVALLGTPSFARAWSVPAAEKQKIEALLEQASSLKDAQFIRNGSSYSADKAVIFLRRKWQANDSAVKTAGDFIDKVASFSGTSGKPYLIRFKDGKEIMSRDFFLAEMKKIEHAPAPG
jgi:hypothetical protein